MIFVYVFGIFFIGYLLFAAQLLLRGNSDARLGDPNTINRFGSLYSDLKFFTHDNLWFPILFILRRIAFAFFTIYFLESGSVLLFFQFYVGTMITIVFIVHHRPYLKNSTLYTELGNELFCLIMIFFL